VNRRIIIVALAAILAAALLQSCGKQSRPARKAAAPHAEKIAPRYSAAKRRYLANFRTNCAAGAEGADASSEYIQRLIERSSSGDLRALPELIVYLNRLAGAAKSRQPLRACLLQRLRAGHQRDTRPEQGSGRHRRDGRHLGDQSSGERDRGRQARRRTLWHTDVPVRTLRP
jgi:hypothetical protein